MRDSLARTGKWAHWVAVFLAGCAMVNLVIGALRFWRLHHLLVFLGTLNPPPGSPSAHLRAAEVHLLEAAQSLTAGIVVFGVILGGVMGWLALRFGRRLGNLGYGDDARVMTDAASAQRTFWRTQAIILIAGFLLSILGMLVLGTITVARMAH